jgi:hypothetical protein
MLTGSVMKNVLPSIVIFFVGLYIAIFTVSSYFDTIYDTTSGVIAMDDSGYRVSKIAPAAGSVEGGAFDSYDDFNYPIDEVNATEEEVEYVTEDYDKEAIEATFR